MSLQFFGLPVGEYHTGGGCMALYGELPKGFHILITSLEGHELPHGDSWMVGLYDADGEQVLLIESTGVREGTLDLDALDVELAQWAKAEGLAFTPGMELCLPPDAPGRQRNWLEEHAWRRGAAADALEVLRLRANDGAV